MIFIKISVFGIFEKTTKAMEKEIGNMYRDNQAAQ